MAEKRDWKAEPISALGLSVRVQNCVLSTGAETIGALCEVTEDEFLACRSFGLVTLEEVRAKLAELGLEFRKSSFDLVVKRPHPSAPSP